MEQRYALVIVDSGGHVAQGARKIARLGHRIREAVIGFDRAGDGIPPGMQQRYAHPILKIVRLIGKPQRCDPEHDSQFVAAGSQFRQSNLGLVSGMETQVESNFGLLGRHPAIEIRPVFRRLQNGEVGGGYDHARIGLGGIYLNLSPRHGNRGQYEGGRNR